jgi:hypothetical protein
VKTRVLLLAAAAAALVIVPGAALGKASHSTVNSQTYADSTGEDANAPDITSIAVSNDDAGLITFKINISNRPALTPDMDIQLILDTDQNAATGDPAVPGAEYLIDLNQGQVGLFKWDGTNYTFAQSQTSLVFTYDATGATIRVSAADLGGTKGFNFVAFAASGITVDAGGNPDFTNAHADLAPDLGHGLFNYKVIQVLKLSVLAFTTSPKPPKAGKNFSAGFAANESDTNGPVKAGTVACSATVSFKHITPVGKALKNGIAVCVWHLPATAKGKTIRGTVTLTVQGVKVTRSFAAKIT